MTLRVIAGELGGRRIRAPAGRGTRPTPERVREAWFSALGGRLSGLAVLDLFAGSGALGIEALSRGAARVRFVESDRRAAGVIRDNLQELGVEGRAEVTVADCFAFLAGPRGGGERYAVALADPPYGSGEGRRLLERFVRDPFADLLCLEHGVGTADELREVASPDWHRTYGDTALSFFRPGAGSPRPESGEAGRRDEERQRRSQP